MKGLLRRWFGGETLPVRRRDTGSSVKGQFGGKEVLVNSHHYGYDNSGELHRGSPQKTLGWCPRT